MKYKELQVNQIKKKRLTEEVVDAIISLIVSEELKLGDKLPPERNLMKQFGVGRGSLREAMGSLSLLGVLDVRAGSGTYVTISPDEFLSKPLSWGVPMVQGKIKELVEVRLVLEEAIAALAAERANEAEIAELEQYLAQLEANKDNVDKGLKADMAFHTALAKACHNTSLFNFFMQIRHLMRSWMEEVQKIPKAYDPAIEEHGKILSAVKAHDAEVARSMLRRHLERGSARLATALLTRKTSNPSP